MFANTILPLVSVKKSYVKVFFYFYCGVCYQNVLLRLLNLPSIAGTTTTGMKCRRDDNAGFLVGKYGNPDHQFIKHRG